MNKVSMTRLNEIYERVRVAIEEVAPDAEAFRYEIHVHTRGDNLNFDHRFIVNGDTRKATMTDELFDLTLQLYEEYMHEENREWKCARYAFHRDDDGEWRCRVDIEF